MSWISDEFDCMTLGSIYMCPIRFEEHLLFGKRVWPHSASHVFHFPLSRKLALKLSKFGLFENTIIEYQMCSHKLFRLSQEEQFFTDKISWLDSVGGI